jgi:hypothetical protein
MKLICAYCNRKTEPAVIICGQAVGPKCARRAGLMPTKTRARGFTRIAQKAEVVDDRTMDLFEEIACPSAP